MTNNSERKLLRDIEPWIAQGLTLQSSNIHGYGVFATLPFSNGDLLMRLGGFLLKREWRNTKAVIPSTSTAVAEDVILSEVEDSKKDLSDYLNHCCEPNAGFIDAITLVATRMISPGEEISIDYVYCESDESWTLRDPCSCKAVGCRRQVSGSDWRNPSVSERFLLWASPFIKRRIYQLNQL